MANIITKFDNFLNEEFDLFGKKKKEKEKQEKKETNKQLFRDLRKILKGKDYFFYDMTGVSNTMYAYRANKKQHFCLGPEGKETIHLEELEFLGDRPEGELLTIDLTGDLEAAANKIIKAVEKNYKEYKNESVTNESIAGAAFALMAPLGVLAAAGIVLGYKSVENFIEYTKYKMARTKIGHLIEPIKNDRKLQELLDQLMILLPNVSVGEQEGPGDKIDQEAYELKRKIKSRIKELLSPEEYEEYRNFDMNFGDSALIDREDDNNTRYGKSYKKRL